MSIDQWEEELNTTLTEAFHELSFNFKKVKYKIDPKFDDYKRVMAGVLEDVTFEKKKL